MLLTGVVRAIQLRDTTVFTCEYEQLSITCLPCMYSVTCIYRHSISFLAASIAYLFMI